MKRRPSSDGGSGMEERGFMEIHGAPWNLCVAVGCEVGWP